MKTVKQIVENHLREIGADGLVNEEWEEPCSCGLDILMDCEVSVCHWCVPARLIDGDMVPMKEEEKS